MGGAGELANHPSSVDRERTSDGVTHKPKKERLYVTLFIRTLVMSLVITMSCILLGYPIAYLLATLPTLTFGSNQRLESFITATRCYQQHFSLAWCHWRRRPPCINQ